MDGKRYLEAVLMRLWLCFGVCHPFLSNTERSRSRWVGMTRLQHKSRHKPDCPLESSRGYPPRCRMDAPARAQFRKNKNGAGVGALMVLRRPGYRRWLTLGRGALRLQPFRKAGGPRREQPSKPHEHCYEQPPLVRPAPLHTEFAPAQAETQQAAVP